MKEKEIKLEIKGSGIGYSAIISPELAGTLINVCLRDQNKKSGEEASNLQNVAVSQESVAEYVSSKGPKRNPDKILAIAGFLKKSGIGLFSPEDIKPYFPKIVEPVPTNFGRDFRWAIANRWITEHDKELNKFYITNTGIKVLGSNFSKEIMESTTQTSKLKNAKRKRGSAENN